MEKEHHNKISPYRREVNEDVIREYQNNCVLFGRFFDLSMDLLCIAGKDGIFTIVNPAFDTLGYSREELTTKPFLDFVHPEDVAATREQMDKLLIGVPAVNFENRYVCKDGSIKWLGWTSVPDEKRNKFFAVARDITEEKLAKESLKKSEEELRQVNMELKQAIRDRDDLIGIISHELKNPLSALQLRVQFIKNSLPKDPLLDSTRKRIEQLNLPIKKMSQLINDLLDIETVESGALKIESVDTDLLEIVSEVIKTQEAFALEKSIVLSFEIPEDARKVFCDPGRTMQVLTNLIHNGIKFTNLGGQVKVSARRRDNQVEVKVKDSGVGISPDSLPHVFGRFWQDKSRSSDNAYKGTGLGLSIVKSLVEAQGGVVWVESHVGVGSSFFFTIPLRRNSQ